MSKFVKFLGRAHINFVNVALYETGAVRAENVVNGKSLGGKSFPSAEAAEEWFDAFKGDNTARTAQAIENLKLAV